jgi:hypothetical protein
MEHPVGAGERTRAKGKEQQRRVGGGHLAADAEARGRRETKASVPVWCAERPDDRMAARPAGCERRFQEPAADPLPLERWRDGEGPNCHGIEAPLHALDPSG